MDISLFADASGIFLVPLVSFAAWLVSMLAGGGSPFILIPLITLLLGATAVPPVITIGMLLGNAHRAFLFRSAIDWQLTRWYAPGAVAGAILGAYAFTQLHLAWIQLLIGLFLVISIFSVGTQPKEKSHYFKAWHILPAAFFKAFISGLIGTTGPILNPFYLSYGLIKDELIATKAAHMVIVHSVKIITYAALGALSTETVSAGLIIGIMSIPANLVGKRILARISAQQFQTLVLSMMLLSGLWILWGQRDLLLASL
jgi:uncharacterized protein